MSQRTENARFDAGLALDNLSGALMEAETKILDLGNALAAANGGTGVTPELRRLVAGLNDCDAAIQSMKTTLRAMA